MFAIGRSPISLGRNKLGQLIGLGQGEVKTLISRLKEHDLITVNARGCIFTEKGIREFHSISNAIPFSSHVGAEGLKLGKSNWAVLIRGKQRKINKGIEQRDAAIKAGASGAVTVVYSSGRFMIPDGVERIKWTDCEALGPSEPWMTIRRNAKPRQGDLIIISGGDSPSQAEDGALASVLTIL